MKHKDVYMQVLRIFLCEVICILIMLAVYFLLDKFSPAVLLGTLAGGLLAIGNFLFLSISVSKAVDRAAEHGEDAAKAKLSIQRDSIVRKIVLLVLYVLLLKSGSCDLLATILPLVFVQLGVYITGLFRKGGAKK